MELDTANNPAAEAEEAEAPELATEETPEEVETEAAEESDEVDFDYEGKALKLPKALADILADVEETKKNIQRDATAKWQDAAEQRKQVAAEREQVQRERTMHGELQDEALAVRQIDQRLTYLNQIDPYQLSPEQKAEYSMELSRLNMERQHRIGNWQQKAQALEQETVSRKTKTLQGAYEELQKPDPKFAWSGQFDKSKSEELTRFLSEHGAPADEIQSFNQPWLIKMFNLAKIGKASLEKQQRTPARASAQPAAKVPTAKASTMSADPSKWSIQQMSQHLKKTGAIR